MANFIVWVDSLRTSIQEHLCCLVMLNSASTQGVSATKSTRCGFQFSCSRFCFLIVCIQKTCIPMVSKRCSTMHSSETSALLQWIGTICSVFRYDVPTLMCHIAHFTHIKCHTTKKPNSSVFQYNSFQFRHIKYMSVFVILICNHFGEMMLSALEWN